MSAMRRVLVRHSFIQAVLIVLAAALGTGPLGGDSGPSPRDRRPAPTQPIKALVLKEDLTIGVPEGDEKYMFGSSVSFNVDDHGHIYATDWGAKQVKKYGPDGKHILTFGRLGQGPGEFQNPGVVRFTKDGVLYISENFSNRLIFFDGNGVYLRQSRLPSDIYDIWITPAGTYLGSEQVAPQYVGQGPVENFIRVYDGSFKPILELHRESFVFPDRALSQAQGLAQITNQSLARPAALAAMGPDGRLYFGRTDVYAIDVLAPEGRKLMTVTRDADALPYRKADIDFMLKEEAERMTAMTRSESVTKEYLGLVRFPKNKPFFRALAPMDDGGLAVVVDIEGLVATWLDIFDPAGTFLGRVRAEAPALNLMFKNGKAYALHRDESGFISIKRYSCEIRR